jgi:hypothetical protein
MLTNAALVWWKMTHLTNVKTLLIHNCRTKMYFVGLKMQFCWTKNVRLNIRNVGFNWFLLD